MVDSGINLESSVGTIQGLLLFDCLMLSQEWTKGGRPEPDWIFVGPFATNQKVDISDNGHGTCMADLAAGWVNGVAKLADITAVQVDDTSNDAFNQMTWLLDFDALAKVVDDINDRGIEDRAVLLVASTLQAHPDTDYQNAFVNAYWTLMNKMDAQGAALVVTTMNDEKCTEWPCMFGDPDYDHHIPHMIVVGAGDIDTGSYYEEEENRNDWPSIFYAPGDDDAWEDLEVPGPIICAAGTGDENALETEGPSAGE